MIIQPGKRYSIIVEKDIHISKAVVDFSVPRTTHSEYATSLIVDCEDKKIILCHLSDYMHVTKLQPQGCY
jgi:energy-converting hydrogenase A subunit M